MGKTRDLFKKIGDTKGTFHAKMGTLHGHIKDRNSKSLMKQKRLEKEVARIHRRIIQKKFLMSRLTTMVWSLKARHPGMLSQGGLRKHHYEQS